MSPEGDQEHQEGLCRLSESDQGVYEAGLELAARSLFATMFDSDRSTTSQGRGLELGEIRCAAQRRNIQGNKDVGLQPSSRIVSFLTIEKAEPHPLETSCARQEIGAG